MDYAAREKIPHNIQAQHSTLIKVGRGVVGIKVLVCVC